MKPHNLTLVMLGAGMLWFGWFGFNAGSALAANNTAAVVFLNTAVATCRHDGLAPHGEDPRRPCHEPWRGVRYGRGPGCYHAVLFRR